MILKCTPLHPVVKYPRTTLHTPFESSQDRSTTFIKAIAIPNERPLATTFIPDPNSGKVNVLPIASLVEKPMFRKLPIFRNGTVITSTIDRAATPDKNALKTG